MDDLPNILQDSYGLRPQGKSAPMSSVKRGGSATTSPLRSGGRPTPSKSPNHNYGGGGEGSGSGHSFTSSNARSASSGGLSSNTYRPSDDIFGDHPNKKSTSNSSPFGDNDIFGGLPKTSSSNQQQSRAGGDDSFGPPKPPSSIFDELYGTNSGSGRSSSTAGFDDDDIFSVGKPSSGGGGGSSRSTSRPYNATAANFDDLLGSGSYETSSGKSQRSKSRNRNSNSVNNDDLLGAFSTEATSPAGRRKSSSKPSITTPTDPFGSVDVDTLFGNPTPPLPSAADFGDPFSPFPFVPATPPHNESTNSGNNSTNGSEGISGLEAFAKFASGESPRERRAREKRAEVREPSDKYDKTKTTSRRSNSGREGPVSKEGESRTAPEPRAPPKISRTSSGVAREAGIAAREAREARKAEIRVGNYSASQQSEGNNNYNNMNMSSDSKENSWFTLDDIVLKTKPLFTPPPSRPPPPIGSQKFPSRPVRFNSPTEIGKQHSEPKSERKSEPIVDPEVEPQPPLAPSWHPPRRPSPHQSGEASRHISENVSGGLDSLDDFASGGGRHRRTASDKHHSSSSTNSQQDHQVRGDSIENLDDFASGGSGRRSGRQVPVEPKAESFPPEEMSERKHRNSENNNYSSMPESTGRSSQGLNSSAEAAEQSAAAMREVLERAKLKAEAARISREREREKERQEVELAAAKARAKATEVQEQARMKAEAEAKIKAEEQAQAKAQAQAQAQAHAQAQQTQDDFDSFFSAAPTKTQGDSWQRAPERGPVNLDDLGGSVRKQPDPVKKSPSPSPSPADNWADVFGGVQVPLPSETPLPGESEERRKLRVEREKRIAERSAEALREKNRRDAEVVREQAERDRAGDLLDAEIKKWAAGKQGNLRALLSTLQFVLWPECNWEPMSLTDLISGNSVKKAYRKATLCVHPDKVQQKGATVQQKYIAEKIFDLLKEAWNKFNSEELF